MSSALDRVREAAKRDKASATLSSQLPKVAAQCGSAARWDLWRGSGVIPFPLPTLGLQRSARTIHPLRPAAGLIEEKRMERYPILKNMMLLTSGIGACIEKKLFTPALILIYSAIDTTGWLG